MNDMARDARSLISAIVANALVSAGLVIGLLLWLRAKLLSEITWMRTDFDSIKERLIRLAVSVEGAHPAAY